MTNVYGIIYGTQTVKEQFWWLDVLSTRVCFQDAYKPERKYKRHDADKLNDEESRVQSTLLEYGRYFLTILTNASRAQLFKTNDVVS